MIQIESGGKMAGKVEDRVGAAAAVGGPATLDQAVFNAAADVPRPEGAHSRSSAQRSEERLVRARALKELTEINEAREALAAATDGLSQRKIASLLGTSQTDVHRMLRRGRAGDLVEPMLSVREVVLQRLVGMITPGTMRGTLTQMSRGESPAGEQVDGYRPGTWDAVRAAYFDGLLSEQDYDELRHKVRIEEWQGQSPSE